MKHPFRRISGVPVAVLASGLDAGSIYRDSLPVELVAEAVSRTPVDAYIAACERARAARKGSPRASPRSRTVGPGAPRRRPVTP